MEQLRLLDHLVGAKQERLWDCEAKRFGGREVDDQRKLGRLLNRKVCGPFTAEDTIDVRGCLPVLVRQISPVRY